MTGRRPMAILAVTAALVLGAATVADGAPPRPREGTTGSGPGPTTVLGLPFGEVQVGTTSAPLVYEYTNNTASPVSVTVAISGAQAADYAIDSDTCSGSPLAAAASCSVGVTFTPSAEYERDASLDLSDGTTPVAVPLTGIGVLPESAVTWSFPRVVGSAYMWTEGGGLARTTSSTTAYLHAIVQRYDVAKPGIYYRRRAETASVWGVTRLNPTTQIGRHGALAAAGSRVYAAWVSYAADEPSPTQPRVLYVRVNTSYGAGTAWRSTVRLTSLTGRVDQPRVAASGSVVYVVYTNASGSVGLFVSRDRGVTWSRTGIGSTTATDGLGRFGGASVSASGTNVVVAWVADGAGTVKVRRSTTSGQTWSRTGTLGTGAYPGSAVSTAARGTRTAVSWVRDLDTVVRVYTDAWQPERIVLPSAGGSKVYAWPWNGQVALGGTSGIGVAFEACWNGCDPGDPDADYRSEVVWRESTDNGVTWARSQVVIPTGPDPSGDYERASYPSVIWPSSGTRYVMASRWYGPNALYNVPLTKGTGTP